MTECFRCIASMAAKQVYVFLGQLMWQAADWCHDHWCRVCGAL